MRSSLEVTGVVTLEDPTLTGMVTAEVAHVGIQYGREYGIAIFQVPKRGPNGEFCYDGTDGGRLLMDYGEGGQRWMAPFEEMAQPPPPTGWLRIWRSS